MIFFNFTRSDFSPGQLHNAGRSALEKAIEVQKKTEYLVQQIQRLEKELTKDLVNADEILEEIQKTRTTLQSQRAELVHQKAALGVQDLRRLQSAAMVQYFSTRLNARAVKERLRHRLIQRRFTIEDLERKRRNNASGKCAVIQLKH